MRAIALYSTEGEYIDTIVLPVNISEPDIIQWGERYFMYSKGIYKEAFCYKAFTRKEHDSF